MLIILLQTLTKIKESKFCGIIGGSLRAMMKRTWKSQRFLRTNKGQRLLSRTLRRASQLRENAKRSKEKRNKN